MKMSAVTLEVLAQRLDAVEKQLARLSNPPQPKDWRRVVGMFEGSSFMKQVIEEGKALRQMDRESAQREASESQP
jgi:hypothetical protein